MKKFMFKTFKFVLVALGLAAFMLPSQAGTHIHGREFTTSAPGIYIVGLRVIELSTKCVGRDQGF